MADTASFDITSTVDFQEVDNAINQARKEVGQRYDFKGAMAEIELEYFSHRGHQSPIDALRALLDTLRRVQVETLRARRDELRPLVAEVIRLGRDLEGMLGVID